MTSGSSTDHDGRGQLWTIIDAADQAAYVGHETDPVLAIENGYDADGRMLEAYDTAGRRYTYTHQSVSSTSGPPQSKTLLTSVEAFVPDGSGGWTTTGAKVSYDYYTETVSNRGEFGWLREVTVDLPLPQFDAGSAPGETESRSTYYTYADASDGTGLAGTAAIEGVLLPEGYRGFVAANPTADLDTASISSYFSCEFRYYDGFDTSTGDGTFNDRWGFAIRSARVDGHVDSVALEYHAYDTFSFAATASAYDPEHASFTLASPSSGKSYWLYFDEAGQPLSKHEETAGFDRVTHFVSRGELSLTTGFAGTIELVSTPLATSFGGNPNPPGTAYKALATLRANSTVEAESADGALIRIFPRVQTGAFTGFMASRSWQSVETPSQVRHGPHALEEYDYLTPVFDSAASVDVGDDYLVIRPLLWKRRTFNNYKYLATDVLDFDESVMAYEFHAEAVNGGGATSGTDSEWLAPRRIETTHPVVSAANNGSGVAATSDGYYRADGTLIFARDEASVYSYTGLTNNRAVRRIEDVRLGFSANFLTGDDPSDYFDPIPATAQPVQIEAAPLMVRDEIGRETERTTPSGRVITHRYEELADGRVARVSSAGRSGGDDLGPFDYVVMNDNGRAGVRASIAVTSTSSSPASWLDDTESDPILAASLGSLGSLMVYGYNAAGDQLETENEYNTIPASGVGLLQTNYDAAGYSYDPAGDVVRVDKQSGTFHTFARDPRGSITRHSTGSQNPSALGSQVALTTTCSDYGIEPDANGYYQGIGCDCIIAVGTGVLPIDNSETQFQRDIFGRAVFVRKAVAPYQAFGYDNLGRQIAQATYSSIDLDSSPLMLNGSFSELNPDVFINYDPALHGPDYATTDRIAYSTTDYDERGRVVRQTRHNIDTTTGLVVPGETVTTEYTYDDRGLLIREQGERLVKYEYDRLRRVVAEHVLSGIDDSVYADAQDVSGDVVEQETRRILNPKTGQVLLEVRTDRADTAYGTSEHRGALDTNSYTTILATTVNPTNLTGRAQITLNEYDDLDRLIKTSNFGTGGTDGGSTFDPDSMSPPASLDMSIAYDAAGRVGSMTDPLGRVETREYDDAGRLTRRIENDVASPSDPDEDRITEWVYLNGQLHQYVAHEGASTQTTTYSYAPNDADPDDGYPSRDFVRSITYPDGGVESFVYEDQFLARRIDPAGNEIELIYDLPGRILSMDLTAATGFDDRVAKIEVGYTDLGRVGSVIQKDGSNNELDRIEVTYDGWTNLDTFVQDPDGTGTSFSAKTLDYDWQDASPAGGRRSVRLAGMALPSGADIDYVYVASTGSNGGASRMRRVTSILYDAITVAEYEYMGRSTVVRTAYPTNSGNAVYSDLRDASGDFDALDRYNRPVRSRWNRERSSNSPANEVPFYDISVIWDDNSNVTGVTDHILSTHYNYQYTNDGLNRLTEAKRGAGSGTGITLPAIEVESWDLTEVGNWDEHKLELNSSNPPNYSDAGEFIDDGIFNDVNEITSVGRDTDNDGMANTTITPTYNTRGDLTDDGEDYAYEYDVLGRLVKIFNSSTSDLISEYRYNGLGYRIGERIDTDADGVLETAETNWRYFIYDPRWRLVEVYEDTDDANPTELYVHHAAGLDGLGGSSYIDHLVLRDRDTDADGVLDEINYYCQNWRDDVVATVSANGGQLEQFRYSAYGVPYSIPVADYDLNGVIDAFDSIGFNSNFGGSPPPPYNVRADVDLNGALDFFDVLGFLDSFDNATVAGRGDLSSFGHRFGYAGYWYVPERGLYHVRNRWYQPENGRWLTRDPLGYVDGPSLVQYTGNSPLVWTDHSGLARFKYFIRTVDGAWKQVSQKIARQRYANGGDVKVTGAEGRSGQARSIGTGRDGNASTTRHDGHREDWHPHHQNKSGDGSHVFYAPAAITVPSTADWLDPDRTNRITPLICGVLDFINPLHDIGELYNLADTVTGGRSTELFNSVGNDVIDAGSDATNWVDGLFDGIADALSEFARPSNYLR